MEYKLRGSIKGQYIQSYSKEKNRNVELEMGIVLPGQQLTKKL